MFDPSQTSLIGYAPWRYTTQPTYDANGNELTPGVKQTLSGVFVMLDDALIEMLRTKLDATEQAEISGWVYRVTGAEAATWHVPVWAGQESAVFLRVPAAVWASPTTSPPAKVKRFFAQLYSEMA